MRECNQYCEWNDSSEGCVKPVYAKCKMSNLATAVKPQTNADRIRSMSDEELATDLLDMFEEIFEDGVPSKEWMMMWLKKPVEDGDKE